MTGEYERRFIKHVNHRVSVELRPTHASDDAVRTIARSLERAGLVASGAEAAPRFAPHLTFFRCATHASVASSLAPCAAAAPSATTFDRVTPFGVGRIVTIVPEMSPALARARAVAMRSVPLELVDPLVLERGWNPHVTIAYDVPLEHRDRAAAHVQRMLPLTIHWATVDAWDLDVRPTALLERIEIAC